MPIYSGLSRSNGRNTGSAAFTAGRARPTALSKNWMYLRALLRRGPVSSTWRLV